MTQENIKKIIDLLDLQPQTETGTDDFIFGNYIEFPSASQIDSDLIPSILEFLSAPLPFDLSVDIPSLTWLRSADSFTQILVLEALGAPVVSISGGGEGLLKFPDLSAKSQSTLELVDHLMPTNQYEQDLPTEHQYWQPDPEDSLPDPDDELLKLYRSRPVKFDKLISELKLLQVSFDGAHDSTIQKAIVLACFSLVESFTRQRALENAPRLPESPFAEKLLLEILGREVQSSEKRAKVVRALEPNKHWDKEIPHWQLRNALAHDIGSVFSSGGTLSFEGRKSNAPPEVVVSSQIFSDLIDYANRSLQ